MRSRVVVCLALVLAGAVPLASGAEDQFNGKTAAQWLTQLQTATSDDDKYSAAQALAQLPASQTNATPTLIALLGNPLISPNLRYEAANAIASVGSADAIPTLIAVLQETDANLRGWVVKALGALGAGCPDAVAALTQVQASESNQRVRVMAAAALKLIQQRQPVAQPQSGTQN